MHILLVEDNEGDIELTEIAFKKAGTGTVFSVAHDGIEALDLLKQQSTEGDGAPPDLILLDLNMPRMGGRQFLEAVKDDLKFRSIPVIVFTSSAAPKDIDDSYQRHANCYIMKPFNFEKFVMMAQQIEAFWGHLVRLPARAEVAAA
jgi:CheY-like chemotaxis protein